MEVKSFNPVSVTAGEIVHGIYCIEGWVGNRADLVVMTKRKSLASDGIEPLSSDHLAHSLVTILSLLFRLLHGMVLT
jgi:hypothetical protein